MDAAIQAKVDQWLCGNYDGDVKETIRKQQRANPDEQIGRAHV